MVSTLDFESSDPSSNLGRTCDCWLRGATVARLTPDQKAACSNHVGVKILVFFSEGKFEVTKFSLPPMRIELMTFGLQDQRSATEL